MIVLILVFRLVIGEQMIDVLGPEKRRRRTTQEKIAIVQQIFEPGMAVSLVTRHHSVAARQLFLWLSSPGSAGTAPARSGLATQDVAVLSEDNDAICCVLSLPRDLPLTISAPTRGA